MAKSMLLSLTLLTLGVFPGCGAGFEKPVLFADTLTTAKDGFTLKSPQSACDGEPVTFDFAPDRVTSYAVFQWPDGSTTYVDRNQKERGFFRATKSFDAGQEPRNHLVRATAYLIRGQDDWFFDKDAREWTYHPTINDNRDEPIGKAQMTIICYRPEVALVFPGHGKRLADVVLAITKDDGTTIRRRMQLTKDESGLSIVGPDQRGSYQVRYAPSYKEINRAGKTAAELVVTYEDGTQESIRQDIPTP